MSDREQLAAVLYPTHGRRTLADKVLASSWLRERDRQVREATKAGIAEALDDLPGFAVGKFLYGHERDYADGRDAGIEHAADIAREWEPNKTDQDEGGTR